MSGRFKDEAMSRKKVTLMVEKVVHTLAILIYKGSMIAECLESGAASADLLDMIQMSFD